MTSLARAPLFTIAVLTLLAVACGGSSKPDATPTPPVTAAGTGTIVVSTGAIRNQAGNILLVLASRDPNGAVLARMCARVLTDAFATTGLTLTKLPDDGNPCGTATQAVNFPDGRYVLTSSIYSPTEQAPIKQTLEMVDVKGNVVVQLNGDNLSR